MNLKTYLASHGITHEAFAKKVGASAFGVRKWVRGERIPRREAMRKIQKITKGLVAPADFFGPNEG